MTEAIEIRDLQFRWHRSAPLVLSIGSFHVSSGERVFLKGPSGSGKTTLLNILGGVAQPQNGAVKVCGIELSMVGQTARDRMRADQIGFIFQQFNLVPYLDLLENVMLPCRFSGRRRSQAIASGGVEAEAVRLLTQLGLDVDAFEKRAVSTLSVGQQQRVAAARALIGAPGLIIADEPTSALDIEAGEAFLDLVLCEAKSKGAAVLFVSHDARLESAFDRIVDLPRINQVLS